MAKVKLIITESNCRSGYFKSGEQFDAKCPDGGRVCIHGEIIEGE